MHTEQLLVHRVCDQTHYFTFTNTQKEMYLTFLTIIRAQWTVPQLSIMIIYNCIWSNLIQ